jgi:probable phosphoglycerate mutase
MPEKSIQEQAAEAAPDPAAELTRVMRRVEQAFLFGVPGTTEIWLVRHADCYTDLVETGDPPLSELGRRQAGLLAERLRRVKIDAVYSSDSRRAAETAMAISAQVTLDRRLREIENDPTAAVQLILNRHQSFTESAAAVAQRMGEAVDEAAKRHPGGRVALLTHGVAILCYIGSLMGLEIPSGLRLMPYYTSVSVVRANLDLDRRMVGSLFDATHLAGLSD